MSHHDNIQLLRALGTALSHNAAETMLEGGLMNALTSSSHPEAAKIAEQAARLIVCDLAKSCLDAAADIEKQHRQLVERMSGGRGASSDA